MTNQPEKGSAMTETMTVETEVETVEAPKQGALKKFAKAFAAKVRKAAQAVKATIVRILGDNEHAIENEGVARKITRIITAVPKWIALAALGVVRFAALVVVTVIAAVAITAGAIIAAVSFLAMILTLVVFKVCQGIALIVRTPYLLAVSMDAFKCDWSGYLLGWTPRYFKCTRIAQVHGLRAQYAKLTEANEALARLEEEYHAPEAKLIVHSGGKGHETPKQHKTYPARIPTAALAGAEA